jgi:hypothetical protein
MRALTAVLLLAIGAAWAQSPRDEYRRAYQAWRQTEPALESDAGAAGDLAARAERASAAARAYVAARVEFLDGISREASDQLQRIRDLNVGTAFTGPLPDVQITVTRSSETVRRVAESFGAAADPGIRQLRNALQQERAALDAISQAMVNSRRAMEAAVNAAIDLGQARETAVRAYEGLAAARAQSTDQMRQSEAAWVAYYRALANPPSAVTSAAPPKPAPAVKPGAADATANAAPVARPPAITPLPLLRYTGGWTFPANGVYHGTQPEFVDLTVKEANGHVTGVFSGRFRLPPGSTADPMVAFTFEGDLTPNRNQTFNLRTRDGVSGTIELIPGPAFNLLEVNFQMELRPNRVRAGNFLLIKK